jgi:hypothetical protein
MSRFTPSNAWSDKRETLLSQVLCDLTLRRLSDRERLALGVITILGLLVRASLQYKRIFMGDEIGTLHYLKESPGYLLSHFTFHLTMNYFILAEKAIAWLCGATDWRLTLLPLAGGMATIPLTALLALKLTGFTRTALIAAALTAFNPYLVMWGPIIRSYTWLVAFSLLAINEFFRWYCRRDWWSGGRCAAAVVLLVLTHLNGVYTVAFLILLLAIATVSRGWSDVKKFLWGSRTLWIPLAGAAVLVGVAYWRLLPDIATVNRKWGSETPPTSIGYLPQLLAWYMGFGYAAVLSALLLLLGTWSAIREKRLLLLLWGAITLGPILMSLQGVSVEPSDYARYLIFSLPLLLIMMAEGIDWLARHSRMRRSATVAAWSLMAVVVLCWAPYISQRFLIVRAVPWAQVAKFLHAQMQKDDVIVAGWKIGFTLGQFFEQSQDRIKLPDTYVNKVATRLDAPAPGGVFYVTEPNLLKDRKSPIRRFGQLEVTIYRGDTARALLQEWREDLLRRTAGIVAARFEGDYQLLALIEERLPSGQSADHWRSLADECFAQNPSVRGIPSHLLKRRQWVKFP